MKPTRKRVLALFNLLMLPVYLVFAVLAFGATFVPVFPSRTGLRNLHERLGAGFLQAHVLLAGVFLHYLLYVFEAVVLWPLRLSFVDNEDELAQFLWQIRKKYALPDSVGIAFVGPHFGNIEIMGQALSHIFASFPHGYHVLAKPGNRMVTWLLDWYRTSREINLLWTGRKDLFRAMVKLAREGESLAFLIDQKPATGGAFVKFFGAFSAFPYRGLDTAMRYNMPVVYCTARRVMPGCFRFVFAEGRNVHLEVFRENEKEFSGGSNELWRGNLEEKELAPAEVLAGFAWWLERVIRQYPTQWFWDYRKWSRKLPVSETSTAEQVTR